MREASKGGGASSSDGAAGVTGESSNGDNDARSWQSWQSADVRRWILVDDRVIAHQVSGHEMERNRNVDTISCE